MRGAVALAVCGLWLAGCARGPAPEIRFPSPGAKLANPVHLEANTEVRWFDGQAYLGRGRVWKGSLSPGTHRVRAVGVGEASLELEVEEDYPLDVIRAVPSGTAELDLPPGKYRVIWGNLSGKPIQAGEPSARTQPPSHTPRLEPVRALEHELLQKPQRKIELKPGKQLQGLPELGSKRSFRLLDLDSPGSELIEARLVWAGANVLAYVHEAAGYDVGELAAAVGPIVRVFDGEILERVRTAFGPYADVDGNARILLLFTPRLNQSGLAVGFFYAGDLLAYGPDNPDSNEADMLYLGVPQPEDFNFSSASLTATACHELQHLVNFSNYTLPYVGNPDPPLSPLWLNEGMSHLAEDLCGYNLLGGNLAFVSRYLERVPRTSLTAADLNGQGDTLERRGAAYLYLRYLMERAGGLALQNGRLVDKGGLRFTRRVTAERAASHQDVARLAGIQATEALWRYWWTLALSGEGRLAWAEFEPRVLDPVTGDYLGVDLRLGKVRLTPQHAFELNGVKPTLQWPSTLPPAAFALREVQGPCRLELPRAGAVQVLRVE